MHRVWNRIGLATQAAGLAFIGPVVGVWLAGGDPRLAVPVAAVSAFGLYLWARIRVQSRLENVSAAAARFAQGRLDARADERDEAKDLARLVEAVNSAFERGQRDRELVLEVERADIRAVVERVEAFGDGRMGTSTPILAGRFEPIGAALARAHLALTTRTQTLHESSVAVAAEGARLLESWDQILKAASTQCTALRRLEDEATGALNVVEEIKPRFEASTSAVFRFGAQYRRWAQGVRDVLLGLSRYASETSDASDRVRALIADRARVGALWGALADGSSRGDAAAVASVLGEIQASQAKLQRELERVGSDLDRISAAVERAAQIRPPAVADLDKQTTEPLGDLTNAIVRGLELTSASVKTLGRETNKMQTAAGHGREATVRLAADFPGVVTALAGIHFDEEFENALLEVLQGAQKAAERVGSDGMSPAGSAMLAEVQTRAESARARLGALVRATETTTSGLRVG